MNARERAEKIGLAAYVVFLWRHAAVHEATAVLLWGNLKNERREEWILEAQAAVRAAYEIDGVGELVEAAMDAASSLEAEIEPRYRFPDGHIHPAQLRAFELDMDEVEALRAAAASVREAMGGQT